MELARLILTKHKYRGPHMECGFCTDQLGNGVAWPCETAQVAIAILEVGNSDAA